MPDQNRNKMPQEDSPAEVEARMTEALKRALRTPPKPHKPQAELKARKPEAAKPKKAKPADRTTKP